MKHHKAMTTCFWIEFYESKTPSVGDEFKFYKIVLSSFDPFWAVHKDIISVVEKALPWMNKFSSTTIPHSFFVLSVPPQSCLCEGIAGWPKWQHLALQCQRVVPTAIFVGGGGGVNDYTHWPGALQSIKVFTNVSVLLEEMRLKAVNFDFSLFDWLPPFTWEDDANLKVDIPTSTSTLRGCGIFCCNVWIMCDSAIMEQPDAKEFALRTLLLAFYQQASNRCFDFKFTWSTMNSCAEERWKEADLMVIHFVVDDTRGINGLDKFCQFPPFKKKVVAGRGFLLVLPKDTVTITKEWTVISASEVMARVLSPVTIFDRIGSTRGFWINNQPPSLPYMLRYQKAYVLSDSFENNEHTTSRPQKQFSPAVSTQLVRLSKRVEEVRKVVVLKKPDDVEMSILKAQKMEYEVEADFEKRLCQEAKRGVDYDSQFQCFVSACTMWLCDPQRHDTETNIFEIGCKIEDTDTKDWFIFNTQVTHSPVKFRSEELWNIHGVYNSLLKTIPRQYFISQLKNLIKLE